MKNNFVFIFILILCFGIMFCLYDQLLNDKEKLIDEQYEMICTLLKEKPKVIKEIKVQTVEVEKIIEVEVEVQPEPNIYYVTEKEYELLCKIVMWEAGSEPFKCKQMVCQTVLNRVESDLFPNSIYDVLYQENQFSNINSSDFNNLKPSEDCMYAVDLVLLGLVEENGKPLFFEAGDSTTEANFKKAHNYISKEGKTRFYNKK